MTRHRLVSSRLIVAVAAFVCTAVHAASVAPVGGEHGMVVTAHQLATKVGVDVLKRGGNAHQISLTAAENEQEQSADLLALNDALETLFEVDPQRSRIVELRFFGGLTIEETAQVMRVSTPTVERGWRAARAWLQTELALH